MNETEKQLVLIYTIIAIVLIITYLLLNFYDNLREMKSNDRRRWILLSVLLSPMVIIGIFFFFVTIYSIADAAIKNDFLVVQIVTNILNIVLLYRVFVEIKTKLKNRKK